MTTRHSGSLLRRDAERLYGRHQRAPAYSRSKIYPAFLGLFLLSAWFIYSLLSPKRRKLSKHWSSSSSSSSIPVVTGNFPLMKNAQ